MDLINIALKIGKLKKVKRTGWLREGVKNSESVADHSFRLVALSMLVAPIFNLDQNKLMKMAVIHDLGETKIGDMVIERGNVKDPEKRKRREEIEKKSVGEIFFDLEEYKNLFRELIERKSKEAKILWQLDKLEMSIQAYEYEKEENINLEEFFTNANSYIKEPEIIELARRIQRLRKN